MTTTERHYQVTEWGHPREEILTITDGPMSYELWLMREVNRWKEKWTSAWIETNSEGLIALFTWGGLQKPVVGEDSK